MNIYLIRHGRTSANEGRLYCGATDIPLSEGGIAELSELKTKGIYPVKPDLYFTSGLVRAEQTLDLLYGPVYREALPQFMEYHFGDFEMKSYETLKNQSDYQAWITDETGLVFCPGGECKQEFTRRVIKGYESLVKNMQCKNALAVIHGGVITSIMEYLFPSTRNFYEWQPKPGRGYTLTLAPDGINLYQPI